MEKKPTTQEIESQHIDLMSVDREFDQALKDAMEEVKADHAKLHYECEDGIEDAEHLRHITITRHDGRILYDQDFELENAILKRVDTEDN